MTSPLTSGVDVGGSDAIRRRVRLSSTSQVAWIDGSQAPVHVQSQRWRQRLPAASPPATPLPRTPPSTSARVIALDASPARGIAPTSAHVPGPRQGQGPRTAALPGDLNASGQDPSAPATAMAMLAAPAARCGDESTAAIADVELYRGTRPSCKVNRGVSPTCASPHSTSAPGAPIEVGRPGRVVGYGGDCDRALVANRRESDRLV